MRQLLLTPNQTLQLGKTKIKMWYKKTQKMTFSVPAYKTQKMTFSVPSTCNHVTMELCYRVVGMGTMAMESATQRCPCYLSELLS